MQIMGNKVLVFVTKKADQITQLIPKSKVLEKRGELSRIAVNWGYDEAKILRNLRIKDVPNPILGRYEWPGVYTPFAHQRDTAAFLATHPRAFVLSEAGCVDADTEYLTPTGWKRIADYTGGVVAQFAPDTGCVEFVEPIEYIKKPCDLMVRMQTSRGVDQLLSPEHRVLVYDNSRKGKYVVMSAADLLTKHDNCYAGVHDRIGPSQEGPTVSYRHAAIRAHFVAPDGRGVALTDAQLRVQIAVVADGHFPSDTPHCVIRIKRPRKVERLRELLAAAGIEYVETQRNTATAQGFHIFRFQAPLRTKEFGPEFWAATTEQLAVVRDEVMHWDGSIRPGKKASQFFSISKASADFVQYAFAGGGYIASLTRDTRPGKYKGAVCYTVTVRQQRGSGLLALHSSSKKNNLRLAPSTDGFKYCFSVPSTFLVLRRNGCIFTTGNTGKTSAAAWAADYLMKVGEVTRVLIVCPVSIMETAWRSDLFRTVMHRSAALAVGSREQRKKVINGNYEFVIINFDGVKVAHEAISKGGFDLIIVDEANAVKNVHTDRWKALNSILKPDTRLWMMTGTPASQSPVDAYGLAKLVNPGKVPRHFGAFRDMVMTKVTQYRWLPRFGAYDIVYDVLQPAIRYTKEECLDLPDMLYTTRHVPLTKQQQKYYDLILKDMVATAAGEEITAVNAASKINKLLQIAQGAAYSTEREVVEFDVTPRVTELRDVIDNTSHKVIVFVPYRHVMEKVHDELTKHGISVEAIHGGVGTTQRGEIIKRFQTEDAPKVILIIPQAAAHGVTLTRADTVVWWGPVASAELYLQGNARAHRAGQTNKVTVVRLHGSPVEKRIYKLLDNKLDLHSGFVDLFKDEISDTEI